MSEHFNIQITIQRVVAPESAKQTRIPNLVETPRKIDRQVTKVLDLAITADSEDEAFLKAHRMLSAAEPDRVVAKESKMASYPPGVRAPTIA